MKIKNKGFTLIELMVTVVIIGILGAVAVPAYQDYTIRSQVTEGLSLASGAKVQVAEYYSNHGRYPETMADIGMVSSQGSYIQETRLDEDGKITTVFGTDANKIIHDGTISLIPTETDKGNLEWSCEATIEDKYLPTSCNEIKDKPEGPTLNPDGTTTNLDGTISLTEDQRYVYSGIHIYESDIMIANLARMFDNYNKSMLLYKESVPGSEEERKHGLKMLEYAMKINAGAIYTICCNAHQTHIPRQSTWAQYENKYEIKKPKIEGITLKSSDDNSDYYRQQLIKISNAGNTSAYGPSNFGFNINSENFWHN